jgi:hypothetical protein
MAAFNSWISAAVIGAEAGAGAETAIAFPGEAFADISVCAQAQAVNAAIVRVVKTSSF